VEKRCFHCFTSTIGLVRFSRVSKFRVGIRIRVSTRIRVSLVLVIGWV